MVAATGFNGPLLIVARLPQQRSARAAGASGRASTDTEHRLGLTGEPEPRWPHGVYERFPRPAPQACATTNLAQTLRHKLLPQLQGATGATLLIGRTTAVGIDFADVLSSKLPLLVAIVPVLAARAALVMSRWRSRSRRS